MKNRLILFGWSLLALFRVSGKKLWANREANREALRRGTFWRAGEYIENQAQWGEVRFGTSYNMAYGGCGVIAVYNAMKALGLPAATEDMEGLLEYFQRHGAALGGKYGVVPGAIFSFWKKRKLPDMAISRTMTVDAARLDRLGEAGMVFIVTACNGKKLRDWIHTVCITKDAGERCAQEQERREQERGRYFREQYWVHNGYHLAELPEGGNAYCANGPFASLSEAAGHISANGAVPVMVLAFCPK